MINDIYITSYIYNLVIFQAKNLKVCLVVDRPVIFQPFLILHNFAQIKYLVGLRKFSHLSIFLVPSLNLVNYKQAHQHTDGQFQVLSHTLYS